MFSRDAFEKLTGFEKLPGLDQLAEQIGQLFGEQPISAEVQRNLHALIQSALTRMDVVTRSEFDAQAAVLARTRAKLDQIETQLIELASQLDAPQR